MDDSTDIPALAFQVFLNRLKDADVPADVIERLHKAQTSGQLLSETVLREALFNNNEQAQ